MPADSQARHLRLADAPGPSRDDEWLVGPEPRPLITPGTYEAVGRSYQRCWVGRAPKLVVLFDVIVPDAASEHGCRHVRLGRFYNIVALGKNRFQAPRCGDYLREWTLVTERRLTRHARPSPRVFVGALVSVQVVTVETDRKHRPLPRHARYSKVGHLLKHLAGGGQA